MSNLILHCGGQAVNRYELGNVQTPEATDTWQPISHAEFVDMVQDVTEDFGLRVTSEAHGLAARKGNAGANYFGLFEVQGPGVQYKDHSMVIGLRNSHAKLFGAQVALGSSVFVCDNLAFSGEIAVGRRHTNRVLTEDFGIRPLVIDAISKLVVANEHQEQRFEEYKSKQMSRGDAEIIMIDAFRKNVVTSTQLPKVIQQWDTPDHEEFARHKNGWRLFNAFTEALKGTSPLELPRRTTTLHSLMDGACEIPPCGLDEFFKEAA